MLNATEKTSSEEISIQIQRQHKEQDLNKFLNLIMLIDKIVANVNETTDESTFRKYLADLGQSSIDMDQLVTSVRVMYKDIPWLDIDALQAMANFNIDAEYTKTSDQTKQRLCTLLFRTQSGRKACIDGLIELKNRLELIYNQQKQDAVKQDNLLLRLMLQDALVQSQSVPDYKKVIGLVNIRKFTELFRDVNTIEQLKDNFEASNNFTVDNVDQKFAGLFMEMGENVGALSAGQCKILENTPYKPNFRTDKTYSLMDMLSIYHMARNNVRHAAGNYKKIGLLKRFLKKIKAIHEQILLDSEQFNFYYKQFTQEMNKLLKEDAQQNFNSLESKVESSPGSNKSKKIKNSPLRPEAYESINNYLTPFIEKNYFLLPEVERKQLSKQQYLDFYFDLLKNRTGYNHTEITNPTFGLKIYSNILKIFGFIEELDLQNNRNFRDAVNYFKNHLNNLFLPKTIDEEKELLKATAANLYSTSDVTNLITKEEFVKLFVNFVKNGLNAKEKYLTQVCKLAKINYDKNLFAKIKKDGIDDKSNHIQEEITKVFFSGKSIVPDSILQLFNRHFVIIPTTLKSAQKQCIAGIIFNLSHTEAMEQYLYIQEVNKFKTIVDDFLTNGFKAKPETLVYLFDAAGLNFKDHESLIEKLKNSKVDNSDLNEIVFIKDKLAQVLSFDKYDKKLEEVKQYKKSNKKVLQNIVGYYVSAKAIFDGIFATQTKEAKPNGKAKIKDKNVAKQEIEEDKKQNKSEEEQNPIIKLGTLLSLHTVHKTSIWETKVDALEGVLLLLGYLRTILSKHNVEKLLNCESWNEVFAAVKDPDVKYQIIFTMTFISEIIGPLRKNLFDDVITKIPNVSDKQTKEMIELIKTLRIDGNSAAHHMYDNKISVIKLIFLDEKLEKNLTSMIKGLYMQRHVKETKSTLHAWLKSNEKVAVLPEDQKDYAKLKKSVVGKITNPLYYEGKHFSGHLATQYSSIFQKPNKHAVFVAEKDGNLPVDEKKEESINNP